MCCMCAPTGTCRCRRKLCGACSSGRLTSSISHFSYGGWLLGVTTGLPSKNVMLRIRQTTTAARGQLDAPRMMIAGKIRNCRVLLRRNGGEAVQRTVGQLAALARQAEEAGGPGELLGIEGVAARLY